MVVKFYDYILEHSDQKPELHFCRFYWSLWRHICSHSIPFTMLYFELYSTRFQQTNIIFMWKTFILVLKIRAIFFYLFIRMKPNQVHRNSYPNGYINSHMFMAFKIFGKRSGLMLSFEKDPIYRFYETRTGLAVWNYAIYQINWL